jgi:hypothetical protein
MRRKFLAGAAVVLAFSVTSCGQAKQPSLGPGARGSHTTVSNRATAIADAHNLLAMVHVPLGSRLVTAPRDDEFEQVKDFIGVSASATASRSWIVHGSVDRLLRYVVAHLRPGSKWDGSGNGGPDTDESQIRSWPPVTGVLDGRWLQVQAYSYGTHTYLTARAQSQWVITREASERIPSRVTKITIKVTDGHGHTTHDLTVTKPGIVGQIIGLYNSLGVIQPATIMGCPGEPEGSLTLRFYDSPTNVIATASSSAGANQPWPASTAGWACFPIGVRIGQHHYPSLSGDVITPLGKLIHIKLSP